jgi:hypothetical protein
MTFYQKLFLRCFVNTHPRLLPFPAQNKTEKWNKFFEILKICKKKKLLDLQQAAAEQLLEQ